jgi:hypothetical protein
MKTILNKLERHYKRPVDIEFAVELTPGYPKPSLKLVLLQCRPLNNQDWNQEVVIPKNVPRSNQIFSSNHLVPQGIVENIKYIIYVDPVIYSQIPSHHVRLEIARVIGRLNKRLADESFVLMGPGRWGSSNLDLGVKVSYADIYNTRMLIEIAVSRNGVTPEVSYGTHFFQDLIESRIFPLSLYPDDADTTFNRQFFYGTPNELPALLPADSVYADYIKVINVPKASSGKYLRVVMSAQEGQALGYLDRY